MKRFLHFFFKWPLDNTVNMGLCDLKVLPVCFISGEMEVFTTPCEENNTQSLISSQEVKIQAFVEDTMNAHEEFLQRQDQSQMEQLVREEQVVNPEESAQELESIPTKIFGTEKTEDKEQQNKSGVMKVMRNKAEGEQANMSEQCEKKQPPPVKAVPPETDEVVATCGPGPLVTELDEAEQLETIHLPLHRSLHIDDLPDLEDVDTEDFTSVFSSQQVFKPKIEVISGSNDEDEPIGNQSETIPSPSADKSSLFTEVSNSSSSLLYPGDWGSLEPLIFEPVGKPKTNQASSPPRCLIEELD